MNNDELALFNKFSNGLRSKKEYLFLLNEFKTYIEVDLVDATSELIKGFLSQLDNNNNTKRRKYHQLLSFYNFLLDEMIIDRNPVREVKPPKASKQIKLDRTLEFKNIPLLISHLKESYPFRDYLITLIIATTGLKVTEARTLKWSDFFIDNNNLIGAAVGNKDNKRYVRIFDFVWEEINKHRDQLGVDESYMKDDYFLFFSENQSQLYRTYPKMVKPLSSDWLKKTYTKACADLNIPLVTSKDIRHSYTMLCIKLGSPVEDIKEQLGWSSSQFIFRYNGVVELLDSPINNIVEDYYLDILEK